MPGLPARRCPLPPSPYATATRLCIKLGSDMGSVLALGPAAALILYRVASPSCVQR